MGVLYRSVLGAQSLGPYRAPTGHSPDVGGAVNLRTEQECVEEVRVRPKALKVL